MSIELQPRQQMRSPELPPEKYQCTLLVYGAPFELPAFLADANIPGYAIVGWENGRERVFMPLVDDLQDTREGTIGVETLTQDMEKGSLDDTVLQGLALTLLTNPHPVPVIINLYLHGGQPCTAALGELMSANPPDIYYYMFGLIGESNSGKTSLAAHLAIDHGIPVINGDKFNVLLQYTKQLAAGLTVLVEDPKELEETEEDEVLAVLATLDQINRVNFTSKRPFCFIDGPGFSLAKARPTPGPITAFGNASEIPIWVARSFDLNTWLRTLTSNPGSSQGYARPLIEALSNQDPCRIAEQVISAICDDKAQHGLQLFIANYRADFATALAFQITDHKLRNATLNAIASKYNNYRERMMDSIAPKDV